jgi:hypothetical protein
VDRARCGTQHAWGRGIPRPASGVTGPAVLHRSTGGWTLKHSQCDSPQMRETSGTTDLFFCPLSIRSVHFMQRSGRGGFLGGGSLGRKAEPSELGPVENLRDRSSASGAESAISGLRKPQFQDPRPNHLVSSPMITEALRPSPALSHPKIWERQFHQLVEFRRAHGHCRVPAGGGGRVALGALGGATAAALAGGSAREAVACATGRDRL